MSPIPVSEVEAYCRLLGFDHPGFRSELLFMVQSLDAAWMELEAEKANKNGNANPRN